MNIRSPKSPAPAMYGSSLRQFYSTRLENGLTIVAENRDSAVSSAVGFFVKTGARDEHDAISGVSHFLEHMMFKGTATRSALDINYQLAALGAQANAFTSEENTVYYAAVLPEYLESLVELLSDMLRPALDPTEFDVEKKVILEEIALYQDRPTHVLFESALKKHFQGHTAGNSVLGSIDSVSGISRDAMKDYFDSRYSPDNIVVAASGKIPWDTFVQLIERYCGNWKPSQAKRHVIPHNPVCTEDTLYRENLHRAHICMLGNGPGATDGERYAAQVLSCILGDSAGSRTYWELIDKGLADSASIDTEEMEGTGCIISYASASPERLDEVCEILIRILNTPKKFSEADLKRATTKIATRVVLQGESSMRRLMAIGLDWIYRQEYLPLETEIERIQAIRRPHIEALLDRFSFAPQTMLRMLPKEST